MQAWLRHCCPQKVHSPGQQFWAVVPRWALAASPEHLLRRANYWAPFQRCKSETSAGALVSYGPRALEVILVDAQVWAPLVLCEARLTAIREKEPDGRNKFPLSISMRGEKVSPDPPSGCTRSPCTLAGCQRRSRRCQMEKRHPSQGGKMEKMPDPHLGQREMENQVKFLLSMSALLLVTALCQFCPPEMTSYQRVSLPPPSSAGSRARMLSQHDASFLDSSPVLSEQGFPNYQPLQ